MKTSMEKAWPKLVKHKTHGSPTAQKDSTKNAYPFLAIDLATKRNQHFSWGLDVFLKMGQGVSLGLGSSHLTEDCEICR